MEEKDGFREKSTLTDSQVLKYLFYEDHMFT